MSWKELLTVLVNHILLNQMLKDTLFISGTGKYSMGSTSCFINTNRVIRSRLEKSETVFWLDSVIWPETSHQSKRRSQTFSINWSTGELPDFDWTLPNICGLNISTPFSNSWKHSTVPGFQLTRNLISIKRYISSKHVMLYWIFLTIHCKLLDYIQHLKKREPLMIHSDLNVCVSFWGD